MSHKPPISDFRFPIVRPEAYARTVTVRRLAENAGSAIGNNSKRSGFSLVELLVVVSLLALIVLVLMTVFNSTQTAFRAGVTQTDILESSRMAMSLITADLKLMAPAKGNGPNLAAFDNNVSAYTAATPGIPSLIYSPLVQNLPGEANPNTQRTNLLNYCFFLNKSGLSWIGIGYVVNPTNTAYLYPLYRYAVTTNINSGQYLYGDFLNKINTGQWTNLSHLIDGVVDFRVHAFDPNGYLLQTTNFQSSSGRWYTNQNIYFYNPSTPGSEVGYYFFSNSLPAAVEIQMGVLEDRSLKRAQSIPVALVQSNYLAQQVGRVHIFRQRVTIPNVDRTVYQ